MESPYHKQGCARIEQIVMLDDWEIWIRDMEDFFPFLTPLGERTYYPDLMAWKDGIGWVVFEVDGKKGHWTNRDLQKMAIRDKAFLDHDIRTVRIKTKDLVGVKKQTTELILQEVDYQLDWQLRVKVAVLS